MRLARSSLGNFSSFHQWTIPCLGLAALVGVSTPVIGELSIGVLKMASVTIGICLALMLWGVWRPPEKMVGNIYVLAMFGSLWLPSVGTIGGLNLRIHQLVLPLVIISFLWNRPSQLPTGSAIPYGIHFLLLWIALLYWTIINILLGTLFLHPGQSPIASLGRVILLSINLTGGYALAYWLLIRSRNVERWARAIAICGALMAIVSLMVFLLNDLGISLSHEFIVHSLEPVVQGDILTAEKIGRLAGGPNKATFLAGVAILCLVMTFNRMAHHRLLYAVCCLTCLIGVILGIARGAMLALVVGLLIWAGFSFRHRGFFPTIRGVIIVLILATLGLAAVVIFFGSDHPLVTAFSARALQLTRAEDYVSGTAGLRLKIWSNLLADIQANPLWGNGMDAYQKYTPEETLTTENFLLEIFHSTGLWGFIPLIIAITGALWRAWRAAKNYALNDGDRLIIIGLLAGYAGVLAGSLTNSLWGGGLFWMLLGVLVGATRLMDWQNLEQLKGNAPQQMPPLR